MLSYRYYLYQLLNQKCGENYRTFFYLIIMRLLIKINLH
ncbi:unknown [[Mannheimia] succiniciproducens MBEL55E]|uniref:Uncharacterized protein n=1 Tax=Mannheimia succiniciproducens (strain KCTC 0769BP / MBEL55E) TaxID=221988 RepID=Q65V12_MANSM|nr:unknown [[Mannheimia] succiniciproducens MBEL55E]